MSVSGSVNPINPGARGGLASRLARCGAPSAGAGLGRSLGLKGSRVKGFKSLEL